MASYSPLPFPPDCGYMLALSMVLFSTLIIHRLKIITLKITYLKLHRMMIVLSGASSVGKSTLAGDWCRKHSEFHHVREVARDIMRERSITRADLKAFLASENKADFFEFQHQIFKEQNAREASLFDRKSSFIADRGPDPLVFAEQNINHNSALELAETPAAKACLERYRSKNCIVIIICPLNEIEDDRVRMVPTSEEQVEYTKCLKQILAKLNVAYRYCNITDREERVRWLEEIVFPRSVNV